MKAGPDAPKKLTTNPVILGLKNCLKEGLELAVRMLF